MVVNLLLSATSFLSCFRPATEPARGRTPPFSTSCCCCEPVCCAYLAAPSVGCGPQRATASAASSRCSLATHAVDCWSTEGAIPRPGIIRVSDIHHKHNPRAHNHRTCSRTRNWALPMVSGRSNKVLLPRLQRRNALSWNSFAGMEEQEN